MENNFNSINRLAYLNTLKKSPFDLLLEIIEIECYEYNFNELGIKTNSGISIKDILKTKYSLHIDDYILKKWISVKFRLEGTKIKLKSNEISLEEQVKRLKANEEIFLSKVSKIRNSFVNFAFEEYKTRISNSKAKEVFDNYIYSVARDAEINYGNNREYYIFQRFLKKLLEQNEIAELELIENFGIANQIKDLVISGDFEDPKFLNDCRIFIDTPIMIRLLGYDGIDFQNIYKDFLKDIEKAGAHLFVFSHTVEEVWGVVFNLKKSVSQMMFSGKGVNEFLKARKEFISEGIELPVEKDDLINLINSFGVKIYDMSAENNVQNFENYSNWNFDDIGFSKCLIKVDKSFEKYSARCEKDVQSISAISRLRNYYKCTNGKEFKDYKYYLLSDNFKLVDALRIYYKDSFSRYNEVMIETSIMFNLFQTISGDQLEKLNRSLFRAKCLSLNLIDSDFKDELHREARRIEMYNNEMGVANLIANNPYFEIESYDYSLKHKDKGKDFYKIITTNYENYIANIKNSVKNEFNQEVKGIVVAAEKKGAEDYKNSLIENIISKLSKKKWIRFIIWFKRIFNRPFDEEKFLKNKANKKINSLHMQSKI